MTRGGSRGAQRPTLNSLTRKRIGIDDVDGWFDEMENGTDRACALVAVSGVSNDLKPLISTKLRGLSEAEMDALFEGRGAPMQDFRSRIDMAYALRLIDKKVRDNLHILRRIRNAFAHSPSSLSFDHPLVAAECKKLILFRKYGQKDASFDNRLRFVLAAVQSANKINNRHTTALTAQIRRLKKQYEKAALRSLDKPLPPLLAGD